MLIFILVVASPYFFSVSLYHFNLDSAGHRAGNFVAAPLLALTVIHKSL
jgi:hypothetical protein